MNKTFWTQKAYEYEHNCYRFMAMALSGKFSKTISWELDRRASVNAEMAVIAYREASRATS